MDPWFDQGGGAEVVAKAVKRLYEIQELHNTDCADMAELHEEADGILAATLQALEPRAKVVVDAYLAVAQHHGYWSA